MKTKLAGLISLFVLAAQMHALPVIALQPVNEKLLKPFKLHSPWPKK